MTKLESLIKDLKKANQKLKEATKLNPTGIYKDATIKRFGLTFELAWKTIQAWVIDQGLDCESPKSCVREAGRLELINNIEKWFKFLNNRCLIAHAYNEKLADKVYRNSLKFPKEVDKLLKIISQD